MINTDDKLICIQGSQFYNEGEIYTVGRIINDKHFQILTDNHTDHWYATFDDKGIYVNFDSTVIEGDTAYFEKVEE